MEKDWKGYKLIALEFFNWVDDNCFKSINGWELYEGVGEYDGTEYEPDELYDYWIENVLFPELKIKFDRKIHLPD